MNASLVRAAGAALCALAAAAAAVEPEPHPEAALLAAIDELNGGRADAAWEALDRLLKREPNFKLARLYYEQAALVRSGQPARDVASLEAADDGLAEEARLRLLTRQGAVPAGAVPDVILQLSAAHRHAVVVDLPRARLYLLENDGGALRVMRHYYASIGKEGWGKQRAGDNRTPVGVYHVTGFIPDRALPELYGAGAFPLSYPNPWDRRLARPGSGIWLHGVPRDTYARAPRSSEGCVTLANADLMDLKPFLLEGSTPVVFSDALTWAPAVDGHGLRAEFMSQLEAWRASWSARDSDGLLAFYADDFEAPGLSRRAFAANKRRINAARKSIDVQLDDIDLYRYPGGDGLLLARFTQRYRSDASAATSVKEQFWRRQPDGRWRIVREAGN